MADLNIHAETIKDGSGLCFNYLLVKELNEDCTLYFHCVIGRHGSYKAKITPDNIDSIAEKNNSQPSWVWDLLFRRDGSDIIWQVEGTPAKLTWTKPLKGGIKLRVGALCLEKCDGAAAEMLSISAAALLDQKSRAANLQKRTDRLTEENEELRSIADKAVQARQQVENHLLVKFAALLNEKKAKIRALKEVISETGEHNCHTASSVDGEAVQTAAEVPSPAKPGQSASCGRAAASVHAVSDDDDPAEGGENVYDEDTEAEERTTDDEESRAGDSGGEAAYEEDTQVQEQPVAAPPSGLDRQLSQDTDESLELLSGSLDDSLVMPTKRAAPPPQRPPEGSAKRCHITDSDDLGDLV